MKTSTIRSAVLVALMAAFATVGAGCYAEAEVPAYSEGGVTYQPQYYDGYVVYYDDGGRPYYYNNGAVYWVPQSSPYYGYYVNHYRYYGPAYRGWYGRYGTSYRGWRGAPAYRGGYYYRRR
jgi:hypothetical protein